MFISKIISCLGHVIAPRKLQEAQKASKKIQPLQHPTKLFKPLLLLGLCHNSRRFVLNFERLSFPQNKKVKKRESPTVRVGWWKTNYISRFRKKKKLVAPLVLLLPHLNCHYIIETDVCNNQGECILLRQQNGKMLEPAKYYSRPLLEKTIVWAIFAIECCHFTDVQMRSIARCNIVSAFFSLDGILTYFLKLYS